MQRLTWLKRPLAASLVRMEEVIPAMERSLADFSSGRVVQPMRVMVPIAEHQGFLGPGRLGRGSRPC